MSILLVVVYVTPAFVAVGVAIGLADVVHGKVLGACQPRFESHPVGCGSTTALGIWRDAPVSMCLVEGYVSASLTACVAGEG